MWVVLGEIYFDLFIIDILCTPSHTEYHDIVEVVDIKLPVIRFPPLFLSCRCVLFWLYHCC